MSTPAHTPELSITEDSYTRELLIISNKRLPIDVEAYPIIARIPFRPGQAAFAQLFAEAPETAAERDRLRKEKAELLALCKRLTDSAECCVSIIPHAGFKSADGLDALCKEARAAIAKAEGRA